MKPGDKIRVWIAHNNGVRSAPATITGHIGPYFPGDQERYAIVCDDGRRFTIGEASIVRTVLHEIRA